jgi:hypothetical protein
MGTGVKEPEREADESPLSNDMEKNAWLHFPICLDGMELHP